MLLGAAIVFTIVHIRGRVRGIHGRSELPCFIVGILYMSGALLWEDHLQFFRGAWTVLVTGAEAFIGFPGHYLMLAIGGGGGFLVAAGLATRRDWTIR